VGKMSSQLRIKIISFTMFNIIIQLFKLSNPTYRIFKMLYKFRLTYLSPQIESKTDDPVRTHPIGYQTKTSWRNGWWIFFFIKLKKVHTFKYLLNYYHIIYLVIRNSCTRVTRHTSWTSHEETTPTKMVASGNTQIHSIQDSIGSRHGGVK